MEIYSNATVPEVFDFEDLSIGDIFSCEDFSSLYIKTSETEAYCFDCEVLIEFGALEQVIKRKISITIEDNLPYRD